MKYLQYAAEEGNCRGTKLLEFITSRKAEFKLGHINICRCISAVIAGSEYIRLEREHRQRQSYSNGHSGDNLETDVLGRLSAEASIRSAMQTFVKFSAGIVLDSWSNMNRYIQS